MARKKRSFFCSDCGHESSGWLGRCPGCGAWNTFVEAPAQSEHTKSARGTWTEAGTDLRPPGEQVVDLSALTQTETVRYSSGLPEFDRVLGGGFVPGSLVLLGGDPGIGKSTLLLQVMGKLTADGTALYISGEESPAQIRMRAIRLGFDRTPVQLLAATGLATIQAVLSERKPQVVVVDSIQTLAVEHLDAAPGTVSQVREATAGLLRLAKSLNCTIILVGHVTKDGALAGPRVLEHMVDTVLYFEGERSRDLRILRAVKNRFGATDEIGLFEMTDQGLVSVRDAAGALLAGRPLHVPGTVMTASLEGTRTLLLEIQALVSETVFSSPVRMPQGLDRGRLSMLLAVLDKKTRTGMSNFDVYVNVTGGIRITEPSSDLAVLSAIFSSVKNQALALDAVVLGEIGLTGEVRPMSQVDKRLAEAIRLGWKQFVLPAGCKKSLQKFDWPDDCELYFVSELTDALDLLFR